MIARVNENCIGCELCASICPQVFEMTDEGVAEAEQGKIQAEYEDAVLEARDSCPVDAIEVDE